MIVSTAFVCKKCNKTVTLQADEAKAYRCPDCRAILIRRQTTTAASTTDCRSITEAEVPPDVKKAIDLRSKTIGKFLILDEVGRGGGGTVYKAFDLELERTIALKVFQGSVIDSKRTQLEARLASRLNHPNIPRIFETGQDADCHFIAMEFIDGTSADKLIRDATEAIRICRDAALALQYAHSQGIIHRDVKPENIIVDKSGKVWIMDFGIAKRMTTEAEVHLTKTGAILGTPFYMSPEQAGGKQDEIEARSDIFSLGSTCYFLLTGMHPFTGRNLYEVCRNVISSEPPGMDVADGVRAVVMKAMEKEKSNRYQTMEEFAADLTKLAAGEKVAAKPSSTARRLVRQLSIHKGLVVACVVVALISGGAAIAAYVVYGKRVEAEQNRAVVKSEAEMILSAVISDLSNAHKEALRRRRNGEPFKNLREIPVRILSSATFERVKEQAMKTASFHHSLGILQKIVGNEPLARKELEEAHLLGALPYELAMFYFRDYRDASERLLDEWRRRESERRARLGDDGPAQKEPSPLVIEDDSTKSLRKKAVEWIQRSSALLKPNSPERLVCESALRSLSGDYREARAFLSKALEIDPVFEEAVVQMISIFDNEHNLDRAFEIASRALESDKGNFLLFQTRAEILQRSASAKLQSGEDPNVDIDNALKDCETVIRLNDSVQEIYLTRSSALMNRALWCERHGEDSEKDYRMALASLDAAERIDPNYHRVYLVRGILRLNWCIKLERTGVNTEKEYAVGVADLDKAVMLDLNNSDCYLMRGQAKMNRAVYNENRGIAPSRLFEDSIKDMDAALRLNSNNAEVWHTRALAKMGYASFKEEIGQESIPLYIESVKDIEQALKIFAADFEFGLDLSKARMNIALAYSCKDDERDAYFEQAAHDAEGALQMNSRFYGCAMQLGMVYMNWGTRIIRLDDDPGEKFSMALANFEESLKLNPKNFEVWVDCGLTRMNWCVYEAKMKQDPSEHYLGCVRNFDEAEKLNPGNYEVFLHRGNAHGQMLMAIAEGKSTRKFDVPSTKDACLHDFKRAIELNPNNCECYWRRGYYLCKMGSYKEAIADFERAAKLNPSSAEIFQEDWEYARKKAASSDY